MKQTIGQSQFIDAFRSMGRYEQFGYAALCELFEYFESVEDDTGEEIELDVIAICCEYSASDPADIAADYGIDVSECSDDDEIRETVAEYLQDRTAVVSDDCEGQIIYMQF